MTIDPAAAPSAEEAIEAPSAFAGARTDAQLEHLARYRRELIQGFRCIATTSAQLATITETHDPHGLFLAQVNVLDMLVRQLGGTLTTMEALAASQGTA